MKAFKIISVLALLVVFPAISYLYLIKGFNFRMEALQELETKVELKDFNYGELTIQDLRGKATVAFDASKNTAKPYIEPLYEEFSHRKEFQVIGFVSDSSELKKYNSNAQWKSIVSTYPFENDIALIDTSAHIRNYYALDSSSFKSLILHIPIIIPREKEQDIVLKRENEK